MNYMPNVFGTANGNLLVGFDEQSRDHGKTLEKVSQVCTEANIKPNKDQYLFRLY